LKQQDIENWVMPYANLSSYKDILILRNIKNSNQII